MEQNEIVLLSHGGGGLRTQQLIRRIILQHLGNPILNKLDDGACLSIPERELVFTTDSYVVQPIFFPGGDIGKLAACGTINDLAMQGAEPRYLSLGLILEEGFALADLERIIISLKEVLTLTNTLVVTGDTKVVERGKGNGVFINTSGIGVRRPGVDVHIGNARNTDVIIISGTIGDHGCAIMNQRLGLEADLISDVAPLWDITQQVLSEFPNIHCLRDPTRGGLASALSDIAETSNVGVRIKETFIPLKKEVKGVCKLLGLDPLNVANEGKAMLVCSQADADNVLRILRAHPLGKDAAIIGRIVDQHPRKVLLETGMGGERIVEIPMGEDLPRIC